MKLPGFTAGTALPLRKHEGEALDGLPLGAYDVCIVEWAVKAFDQSTLRVFAGLIDRGQGAAK